MGKLIYGSTGEIDIEDRMLAHLQIVIGAKLRRREPFFFSWKDDIAVGDGRSSIWLDSSLPLYFKYFGSRPPMINREWLEVLTVSANSAQGLQWIEEPQGSTDPPKGHV
jgi:hypothetical protein